MKDIFLFLFSVIWNISFLLYHLHFIVTTISFLSLSTNSELFLCVNSQDFPDNKEFLLLQFFKYLSIIDNQWLHEYRENETHRKKMISIDEKRSSGREKWKTHEQTKGDGERKKAEKEYKRVLRSRTTDLVGIGKVKKRIVCVSKIWSHSTSNPPLCDWSASSIRGRFSFAFFVCYLNSVIYFCTIT